MGPADPEIPVPGKCNIKQFLLQVVMPISGEPFCRRPDGCVDYCEFATRKRKRRALLRAVGII
jgi:hypothetical protein